MVRIMARNEVGVSDPLEPEDPVKVIRPPGNVPNNFSVIPHHITDAESIFIKIFDCLYLIFLHVLRYKESKNFKISTVFIVRWLIVSLYQVFIKN